jgi:hypothetical protein
LDGTLMATPATLLIKTALTEDDEAQVMGIDRKIDRSRLTD